MLFLFWAFSSLLPVIAQANLDNLFQDTRQPYEFLSVEEAFQLDGEIRDGFLYLHFHVTPEHYLYKERFSFNPDNNKTSLGSPEFPKGKEKYDENFEKVLTVFPDDVTIKIPVKSSESTLELNVRFQGCAEAGLCYPPETIRLVLANDPASSATSTDSSQSNTVSENSLSQTLQERGLTLTLLLFFLAGVGLTFTPCVLPMIPILSSILIGNSDSASKSRIMGLTLAYIVGMSVTFALAGTLMGLFGASLNLQAKLQSPWVLIPFAGLFVLLALSMFGLYELQLPEKFRDNLGSQQQKSGFGGALLMGALSALVVSPCVSAPLAGALVYISTTGDAFLGGLSLLVLGLGMGLPLLLIGLGGRQFLPKAGLWMDKVKQFFGLLLLGIAIWLLERVIPGQISLLLWGTLAIAMSLMLGALDSSRSSDRAIIRQTLGILLLIYGGTLVIGSIKGNSDPLQPLLSKETTIRSEQSQNALFETVSNLKDLNALLAQAAAKQLPAMIDVYADWCVSCKVMEKQVFPATEVQTQLRGWKLIKFDITGNTKEQQQWLSQYNLFGPPSLVFFNKQGNEITPLRTLGEITAEQLATKLSNIPPDRK
ncbi:protein-disulfide reductase DsbD [Endozoicomonas sp. OPT23]|uniref:protein-disulfide reductase DsbD n=1 Tax=Endozoicomonas sp. OPT23 TaxID=2072845 RepID=UPI001891ADC5|nr:protein-disulfide reductase DsbD [Endozoicomonas sp. OPT23]